MASLFDKVRGADQDEIKRRADEFSAKMNSAPAAAAEEVGLEEGDMSDYIMPITGLGRNLLKAVAEKSVMAAGKEIKKGAKQGILKYVKSRSAPQQPEAKGPDYKNENIAFRPTQKPKQEGWERFNFKKAPAQ